MTLRSGELNAANKKWAICPIVFLDLAAMTLSYAPFRHDDLSCRKTLRAGLGDLVAARDGIGLPAEKTEGKCDTPP